jgi:SAM-dependent methyltransferase
MVDASASQSATAMAQSIFDLIRPSRVVDYGCGTGSFLAAMRKTGCFVVGTELVPAARRMCDQKFVPTVPLDLASVQPDHALGGADLATCFEVAEHLPATAALGLVRLLVETAPVVIFSAATPGQGGKGHVNEQPHDYWVSLFRQAGCAYESETSLAFREYWKRSGVAPWYANNAMVFRRDCDRVKQ